MAECTINSIYARDTSRVARWACSSPGIGKVGDLLGSLHTLRAGPQAAHFFDIGGQKEQWRFSGAGCPSTRARVIVSSSDITARG